MAINTVYIRCPVCETQYTPERCGLVAEPDRSATIRCGLCGMTFDVIFLRRVVPRRDLIGRLLRRSDDVVVANTYRREDT